MSRTKPSEDEELEQLATYCKALAHPARARILKILIERRSCVCGDVVDALPLSQSTVSEHLRILKAAGLIVGEVDGARVCYCVNKTALKHLQALLGSLDS